jgi:RNA polymerase sigma-70 factor (ECF subfamily)
MSRNFPNTSWSLILAAADSGYPASGDALADLCETYWYPLYAYARRSGYSPEEACDCTQGYFTKLLEKHYLRDAHQERGRFRSFLLASFRNYLANERDRDTAIKRGGGVTILPIEVETAEGFYALEPRENLTPQKLFERRWATTLLDRALLAVQREFDSSGKASLFAAAKVFLTGEGRGALYADVADELGMTEGALKVAVHRLRKRFRDAVREEIAATVERPEEVEEELRFLFQAVV